MEGIERIQAASLELQMFAEDQISKYGEKETIGDLKFWGLIFTKAGEIHYKYYVEPLKIKEF